MNFYFDLVKSFLQKYFLLIIMFLLSLTSLGFSLYNTYYLSNQYSKETVTLPDNHLEESSKEETKELESIPEDKYYVDINLFSEGDYVVKKDSNNKYRIEETATLQGVYNINKGYAVFREITILADNEEYCIVEEGTTFGLAQYDHIALDADSVSDDQIL